MAKKSEPRATMLLSHYWRSMSNEQCACQSRNK